MLNCICVIWLKNGTLTCAMDGPNKNTDVDNLSKDASGFQSKRSDEDLYGLYCAFMEESRVAMLRLTIVPESRRTWAAKKSTLSEPEFYRRLEDMTEDVRNDFLRSMRSGYDLTLIVYRDDLLTKYKPAA